MNRVIASAGSVDALLALMREEKVRFEAAPNGTDVTLILDGTTAVSEAIVALATQHKPALLRIASAAQARAIGLAGRHLPPRTFATLPTRSFTRDDVAAVLAPRTITTKEAQQWLS